MDIFLLDSSNNTQEEANIIRPKNYQKLLEQLNQSLKNLPENYELFFFDENNNEVIINNEEKYKKVGNMLFVRKSNKKLIQESMFQMNYDKLSESKRELLDEKYNCILCSVIIKKENPYLCYKCQKIFHDKCLKDWDKQCRENNQNFSCPNCRNELTLDKWNKKLDYEDNRKEYANLINKINELKDINNKTIGFFQNLLNKINTIDLLLKLKNNSKIIKLMNINRLDFENIDEISNIINRELEHLIEYIKINEDEKIEIKTNVVCKGNDTNFNIIDSNEDINDNDKINNNNLNEDINQKNEINNEIQIKQNKTKINLKYHSKSDGCYNIFGEVFVQNNRNNIDLIINNKPS